MDSIEKLTELFREFPGIGPRQAKRFVYHLLSKEPRYIEEFIKLIALIKTEIHTCSSCFRLFNGSTSLTTGSSTKKDICPLCADATRDQSLLLIVEKDIDLESIEKSHAYSGRYFVLGGTAPILEKEPEKMLRSRELVTRLEKEKGMVTEVILAFSVNTEGENTAEYIGKLLKPLETKNQFKISTLGRGFSTGSEVEYADSETLKSALKNRI